MSPIVEINFVNSYNLCPANAFKVLKLAPGSDKLFLFFVKFLNMVVRILICANFARFVCIRNGINS